MHDVTIGTVTVGEQRPLAIIAGPCVAESLDLCLRIGEVMRDRCAVLGMGYIFKASFDKANRSSISSPRGPGIDEGLSILEKVRSRLGVPITTDIHEPDHAKSVGEVVDVLQIPAFLCRQTDLLVAAGKTGKPVNVKKGQFISPSEMANAVEKLEQSFSGPGGGVILTERGTFFGYNRLINDFMGLGDLMGLGWPVCFDATHSTQQPGGGGGGKTSGGRPDCAPLLARCAVAAGVQLIFIETHVDPSRGVSDAATMLPLDVAVDLLEPLNRLHGVLQ